jgi:hypothetical protein
VTAASIQGLAEPRKENAMEPAVVSQTRCEQGGLEIPAAAVLYRQEDLVDFSFLMCKTNARIRVFLARNLTQREVLVDETGGDQIGIMIPQLGPGRHLLFWSFQGAGEEWQTRAELAVNGVTRFRHRKSSDGDDPVNRGFLFLEVA